jgi:serine/threonine-protein kinase RsbW
MGGRTDGGALVGDREFDLRIATGDAGVAGLLDRLEAYAEAAELPPRLAYQLSLVCEELVTNVATHGMVGRPPATYVALKIVPRGAGLFLQFEDDGPAFDPLALAAPDTEAELEERDVGGLGIHLVRTMAREIRYERAGPLNRLDLTLGGEG